MLWALTLTHVVVKYLPKETRLGLLWAHTLAEMTVVQLPIWAGLFLPKTFALARAVVV